MNTYLTCISNVHPLNEPEKGRVAATGNTLPRTSPDADWYYPIQRVLPSGILLLAQGPGRCAPGRPLRPQSLPMHPRKVKGVGIGDRHRPHG